MGRDKCQCSCCHDNRNEEEVRVHPAKKEVRNHTRVKTIKNIHPKEIKNVHRTVVRNENYYPVRESNVNETVVGNYDCGSDVNHSRNCRRVRGSSNCEGDRNHCHKEKREHSKDCSCEKKRPCCSRRHRNGFF